MKKIICPIFLLVFLSSFVTAQAADWSKEYSEEIEDGVVYKYYLKYDSTGFSKLHVVECDLDNPKVDIEVLTAENGSSYLENTKVMAEKNGTLAAINGDFFNMSSKRTNMLGVVYQDGEMVSSPSKDVWATFGITDAGTVIMDYFGFSGKIISPQGYETELYQINKVPVTGGSVSMLTSKWGKTAYLEDNMQALLIKDGRVTAKVSQKGDVEFGDNDRMLLANYTVNGFFNNFNIGDEVKIEYYLTGCNENLKEATGGNTVLVADGKRADFNNVSSGYAQRTAAAVDKSGRKLMLAVCEGRRTNCRGMTQEQLADALIEIGAYRAINFDGGGSSTMVVKNVMGDSYEVKNGASSLRNVSTSVGVVNNQPYIGTAVSGKLELSDKNILKGDYVEPYYKFFDANAHVVAAENVVLTSSDPQAVIKDGRVYLNTEGRHKIYAEYGGVRLEADANVISDIQSAYIYPERIEMNKGESREFSLTVWDFDGNMAYVHPEAVDWISEGVQIDANTVSGESGYIGVKFPKAEIYCSINGAEKPRTIFADTPFMQNEPYGKKVKISAGSAKYSSIADMIRVLNHERSLADADVLYMFGKPVIKELKYWSTNSYFGNPIDSTLIVTLAKKSGSLNIGEQLSAVARLSESDKKNIVVITEIAPGELSEFEKELLFDSLDKAKNNGKNVFIVYNGTTKRTFLQDGITYISCADVSGAALADGESGYVTFYISGDEIKYTVF